MGVGSKDLVKGQYEGLFIQLQLKREGRLSSPR